MRWYCAREIAAATGLHPVTIRRAWRRGELRVIKSPSGYFKNVPEDALLTWLASRGMGREGIPVRIPSSPRQERSAALPSGPPREPATDGNPAQPKAKPTEPRE